MIKLVRRYVHAKLIQKMTKGAILGDKHPFLAILPRKCNRQNIYRAKRATHNQKGLALRQGVQHLTQMDAMVDFSAVISLNGSFAPQIPSFWLKFGVFWSKFFDWPDSTFLSAIISHQMRPSDPKSEKVLKTPPSAVNPLLLARVRQISIVHV